MMGSDTKTALPWLMLALLGGLVFALAGLIVAFIVSFNQADRQYQLATLSERQAGALSQIAELAEAQTGGLALERMLARYRALIDEETALLRKRGRGPTLRA